MMTRITLDSRINVASAGHVLLNFSLNRRQTITKTGTTLQPQADILRTSVECRLGTGHAGETDANPIRSS